MKLSKIAISLALAAMSTIATAEVITFDDITLRDKFEAVANGYHGFNWDNFYVTKGSDAPGTGYESGVVSTPNVAFNWYANPASFSSTSAFTLNSGYFAGAWNDGLTIHVTGVGATTFVKDFVVNTGSVTKVEFNWTGLTSVTFESSGGTPHPGLSGAGVHFAMDNLSVNAVPEPETYAMLLAGLGVMGAVARRRKANKQA